ncbi:MAG: glycosyltransferase family 1 protein [Proteobacteria bacterium]|nr:glycosyltransferase family 1 protein [Pseudomonadota bacterium]
MRVLVATDAWHPQVNGVVRSFENVAREAAALGAELTFLAPERFRTLPMPGYPEIRLALASPGAIGRAIDEAQAQHLHIATEGPIGFLARRHALKRGMAFTTSYHTRFPEYLAARLPVPERLTYAWLRRFHNAGAGCMVSTPSLAADLEARGFANLRRWGRGVDLDLYRPDRTFRFDFEGPILLYVGRVAVEKNIEAFLALDVPGTKVVVGDGPARASLEKRFPEARFLGLKTGEALADCYAAADCFVFPSRTDTFGIVLLEAMASGLPVAAYPVMGPIDAVGPAGALDEDLAAAVRKALQVPRAVARAHAAQFSWRESARQFLANLTVAEASAP